MAAFEDVKPGADNSAPRVLARYLYSVAFAEALLPALHLLEVTLRNAVYDAVQTRLSSSAVTGVDIADCWLDWPQADTVLFCSPAQPARGDLAKVQAAKGDIVRDGRVLNAGRLIAELNFGFWTGLFASHYGQREGGTSDSKKLWPDLLLDVFPNLPADKQSRTEVADRLHAVRKLRNRAFHHEPLWRRRPLADLGTITETIGWIDPVVAQLASAMSGAKQLQEAQLPGYEARARAFVNDRVILPTR